MAQAYREWNQYLSKYTAGAFKSENLYKLLWGVYEMVAGI